MRPASPGKDQELRTVLNVAANRGRQLGGRGRKLGCWWIKSLAHQVLVSTADSRPSRPCEANDWVLPGLLLNDLNREMQWIPLTFRKAYFVTRSRRRHLCSRFNISTSSLPAIIVHEPRNQDSVLSQLKLAENGSKENGSSLSRPVWLSKTTGLMCPARDNNARKVKVKLRR